MANGPARADFWKEFVIGRCDYPAPDRLRGQLEAAVFSEFCDCGCNSFAVKATPHTPPLASPRGGYGAIYTADFQLTEGRTLEIILFADGAGNLAYIEVDCCANSYPVPETISGNLQPLHTWAADGLLK